MKKGEMIAPRTAFGKALVDMAETWPEMVVLDPDVCTSTQTSLFRAAFPARFYAMGIAEANAVCTAAGMAACGMRPWVSTFAVFLATRALDQIRISVAHADLDVKLNGSYGGLPSGRGGATHSSVEDLAIMRVMPNMRVLTPADAVETRAMVDLAMRQRGPVYLRTMRCELPVIFDDSFVPEIGKAVELAPGNDVAILSEGMMTHRALAAAEILAREGVRTRVLHFGSIKPIDREAIVRAAVECGRIVTVENHSRAGGFGSAVCEVLAEEAPCLASRLGFPDVFLESGDDDLIFAKHGLDAEGIARAVRRILAMRENKGGYRT
jgi:transketolase